MFRKIMSVILSAALIATTIGIEAFAAKSKKSNVIFSCDFEDMEVGSVLEANKVDPNGFTQVVSKEGATLLSVENEKGRGKFLRFQSLTTDGTPSGPNIAKTINMGALTNLCIEFDFLGDESSTSCSISSGSSNVNLMGKSKPDWTSAKINIDVVNTTYTVTIGDTTLEPTKFDMFPEPNRVLVKFTSSLKSGTSTCIDNIVLSTTDDITQEEALSPDTPPNEKNKALVEEAKKSLEVTFDTSVPKPISVPEGMNVILYDDCEEYNGVISNANWSVIGNQTYVNPVKISGNQVFRVYNGTPDDHGPSFTHSIAGLDLNSLYFEASMMSNKAAKCSLYLENGSKSAPAGGLPYEYSDGKWHNVKVFIDFKAKMSECYIDGTKVKTNDISAVMTDDFRNNAALHISVTSPANAEAYIDNTVAYTSDSVGSAMFDYKGNINWDMVKTDNPTGMVEKIRDSHPRICVKNWDEIAQKVNTDYWCGLWWNAAKREADEYVSKNALVDYALNERNNLNNTSLSLKIKVTTLSFVGAVTGDKKYSDLAYRMLKHAYDMWPDFGESIALISENVIFAYAIAYDWLYDEFSEEQRSDVLDMMVNRCVYIAVEGYENRLSEAYNTLLKSANNQTSGANTSNLITAISLAKEKPVLAEYLFDKISQGFPHVFSEISKDGAYVETCEYWNYGVTYMFGSIAALEGCLKDGETLPTKLDWANTAGFDMTGDFPIYYNGAKTAFNYGDSMSNFISSHTFLYLSRRYKKPKYAWYELNTTQKNKVFSGRDAVFAIIWYDPAYAECKPGEFELDKFYSSTEKKSINGMSMRSSWDDSDMLFAAMQGGDNSSMHMRPSLGTFVLDYAGERWFLLTGKDASVSTYTLDSQYDGAIADLWHQRTESNNTLVINPDSTVGQNADALATVTAHDSDANSSYGIIDLSKARDDIASWRRGMMMFNNRSRVKIRDELKMKTASEVYWVGHTNAEIELNASKTGALMTIGEKRLYARLNEAPAGATFEVRDISPLPGSPDPSFQRGKYLPQYSGDKTLCVHMSGVTAANVEIEFITLKNGEAPPSDTPDVTPLDSWRCEGGDAFVEQQIGNAVALKIDSPLTFANGKKSFVDSANKDVVPFIQNDRTLVPVRFISESFGANVNWDASTRTVDVKYRDKHITLTLGSAEMRVNDEVRMLDVCADVYNDRTFIPLRALSEALGKTVLWDNRGLIVISDMEMNYSQSVLDNACKYLDIRVFAGGDEIEFSPSKTTYYISGDSREITFAQNHFSGQIEKRDDTTLVIDGKEYKFNFAANEFNGSTGISSVVLSYEGKPLLPDHKTYIEVADVDSSTGWSKYKKSGSIDGIINAEIENRWTGEGEQWISYDLGSVQKVHSFALQGVNTDVRTFKFSVDASEDGTTWKSVLSSADTLMQVGPTVFDLGDVSARYIRLNTISVSDKGLYHSYAEVRFYADEAMENEDQAAWDTIFNTGRCTANKGASLKLVPLGYDRDNNSLDISGYEISYESGNPSCVSVDQNGVCTLLGEGSADITVTVKTSEMLKKTATLTVYVK